MYIYDSGRTSDKSEERQRFRGETCRLFDIRPVDRQIPGAWFKIHVTRAGESWIRTTRLSSGRVFISLTAHRTAGSTFNTQHSTCRSTFANLNPMKCIRNQDHRINAVFVRRIRSARKRPTFEGVGRHRHRTFYPKLGRASLMAGEVMPYYITSIAAKLNIPKEIGDYAAVSGEYDNSPEELPGPVGKPSSGVRTQEKYDSLLDRVKCRTLAISGRAPFSDSPSQSNLEYDKSVVAALGRLRHRNIAGMAFKLPFWDVALLGRDELPVWSAVWLTDAGRNVPWDEV
ncbi:hypothetical protein B0H12DRAFT_1075735 [Mycena haematopus]|nr:hypothetical protein B0H12DRAFT_1075735 [Mycena haematopus]